MPPMRVKNAIVLRALRTQLSIIWLSPVGANKCSAANEVLAFDTVGRTSVLPEKNLRGGPRLPDRRAIRPDDCQPRCADLDCWESSSENRLQR
jgi:hypothetical protein